MIFLISDQQCKKIFKAREELMNIIFIICRSIIENNNIIFTRQSKLEHYGFDMLPRSSKILRKQKTTNNSLVIIQRNKKKRMIEQQSMISSCHSMKTRSQSSSVC